MVGVLRAWYGVAACLAFAQALWGADVRLGVGAAVHLARHPSYDEPLESGPVVFGTAGVEVIEDASGAGVDLAAGAAADWLDWEAVFYFRHTLVRSTLMPFLRVGVGWAARASLESGEICLTALFPEAGLGVEAQWGALSAQVAVSYRPAPFPVPLLAAEAYPLRRIAFLAEARWRVVSGEARRSQR